MIDKDGKGDLVFAEGQVIPSNPLPDGAAFHDYELFMRNKPQMKGLFGSRRDVARPGGLYVFKGTRSYVTVN